MTENDIDPVVHDGLHRAVGPAVPGAAAEERILRALRNSVEGPASAPRPVQLQLGRPLRAAMVAVLSAAVVAGSLVVGFGVLGRRPQSATPSPAISARATPTTSALPGTPAPILSVAQLVERLVPVGAVGAVTLGAGSVYVICNEHQPAGSYSPALAHVVSINRSNGAIHDGGSFPGAESLAFAGGSLWVASGTSPGVSGRDTSMLYRLNPTTLTVEQRTSVSGLVATGNNEAPALTAAGNLLLIGYSTHVARLSVTSGAVIWSQSIGEAGSAVSSLSVDLTGTVVYAGFTGSGVSIAELNAASGTSVVATSAYYGGDLGGPKLAAFVGDVWVAYATGNAGTTVELRASDLSPVEGGVSGLHSNGIDVFPGDGVLWMSDVMSGELFCANPTTGALRASVSWPHGGLIASDSTGTVVGGVKGVSFLRRDTRCYSG